MADNKAVVRRIVDEGWNAGKLEVFEELLAKDFVSHDPNKKSMLESKVALTARLATARAGLLCQLLALSEETLTTQPVAGDWTAKDILAHVAAWDQLHADRVAEILAGRTDHIQLTGDREALNAALQAERRDWSLEHVLDEAQAARAHFLAQLETLAWADISREQRLPGARPMTILLLATRRAEHDVVHTREIQAWREATRPERVPGPKNLLVDALEAGHRALLGWHYVIQPGERTTHPVCGSWTWQDVLGHIADWQGFFLRGLRDCMAGTPAGAEFDGEDDPWNQSHAAARQGEPFEKTWNDFVETRWELLDRLQLLDDQGLSRPVETPIDWLDRVYFWFSAPALHDMEHAEGMEKALASQ
jgi:uncharacterized damage-inducible protein DinB